MAEPGSMFDVRTAVPFLARVEGSPHHAYRDANGKTCLVCIGHSPGGGVPVNSAALKWLGEQPETQFIRLQNPNSLFDVTVQLKHLPNKPPRDGRLGKYAFFDPSDLGAPPAFPPPVGEEAAF